MNPTRFVYGVLLFTLCVFGLPEGCLVFAAHKASRPVPTRDEGPAARITLERLGRSDALTFSARHAE